jgi:hypothetical protein
VLVSVDEIVAHLVAERDRLDELATAMDWRMAQRSVIEARRDALRDVLALLDGDER